MSKARLLNFKVENPSLESQKYGKKHYEIFKNRNSKEFTLKSLRNSAKSTPPVLRFNHYKIPESIQKHGTPNTVTNSTKLLINSRKLSPIPDPDPIIVQESRLLSLEKIRKSSNSKIFQPSPNPSTILPPVYYSPPRMKKISPEKYVQSITFTKSDLNVPSRFVATDRNTNVFLSKSKPLFSQKMYTKRSPKIHQQFPILG